jgi:hypothetical protein
LGVAAAVFLVGSCHVLRHLRLMEEIEIHQASKKSIMQQLAHISVLIRLMHENSPKIFMLQGQVWIPWISDEHLLLKLTPQISRCMGQV